MNDKRVLVGREGGFQLPTPRKCKEQIKIKTFTQLDSARKELMIKALMSDLLSREVAIFKKISYIWNSYYTTYIWVASPALSPSPVWVKNPRLFSQVQGCWNPEIRTKMEQVARFKYIYTRVFLEMHWCTDSGFPPTKMSDCQSSR